MVYTDQQSKLEHKITFIAWKAWKGVIMKISVQEASSIKKVTILSKIEIVYLDFSEKKSPRLLRFPHYDNLCYTLLDPLVLEVKLEIFSTRNLFHMKDWVNILNKLLN